MNAVERWSVALAGWAIPDEILVRAPESPWGFPPSLFGAHASPAGALHRLARAGLEPGDTVLDVGCGGGAASIPLAPLAGHLIGVDSSPDMLESFAAASDRAGVGHSQVLGDWPAVAVEVPSVEVVVCRNVVYNVADIAPFVTALSEHAINRVLVELTLLHPSVALAPLWKHFWNLPRPSGPSAELFLELVAELGYEPVAESETRPVNKATPATDYVAFVRRRLCLPESRDPEIVAALTSTDMTIGVAVAAWQPH